MRYVALLCVSLLFFGCQIPQPQEDPPPPPPQMVRIKVILPPTQGTVFIQQYRARAEYRWPDSESPESCTPDLILDDNDRDFIIDVRYIGDGFLTAEVHVYEAWDNPGGWVVNDVKYQGFGGGIQIEGPGTYEYSCIPIGAIPISGVFPDPFDPDYDPGPFPQCQ